jgi:hypothetical protein
MVLPLPKEDRLELMMGFGEKRNSIFISLLIGLD